MKSLILPGCLWLVLATAMAVGEPFPQITALGPAGGDVRSLAVHPTHPGRLFLGTADGQLYVSEDRGDHWAHIEPGLNRRELVIDNIVFDPADPETMYVAGWELKSDRGELYRSRDGGREWSRIDTGTFQSSIRALAISPLNSQLLALGMNEGVLVSQDGGANWTRISRGYRSLHNVHSLAFDPQVETQLYAGTFRLAWKTPDLGRSWAPIHTGMFWDSDLFSIQIDPRDPSTVFAGACSGIYRSHSGGEQWVKLKSGLPEEAKRTRVVRIDPVDSRTVYAGTTEGLYQSIDGGETWRNLLPRVVINDIAIDPSDRQVLYLGTDDAGALKSVDGGHGFTTINRGFSQRQISSLAVRPGSSDEFFAAVALDGSYGGFFTTADGGDHWTQFNDGLGEAVSNIQVIVPSAVSSQVFLATARGVFAGEPGGRPWTPFAATRSLHIHDLAQADGLPSTLLIAADEGIFRLEVEAGRLQRIEIPIYRDKVVRSVDVSRTDHLAFIGTDMGVFSSADGGKSWEIQVEGLPYSRVNLVRKIAGRLFGVTAQGLYFSDNNGGRWHRVEGTLPVGIGEIGAAAADEATLYASDPQLGYLFASRDRGESWRMFDLGSTISRINRIAFTASGDLLAGTVTEGVVRIDAQGSVFETDLPVAAGSD